MSHIAFALGYLFEYFHIGWTRGRARKLHDWIMK